MRPTFLSGRFGNLVERDHREKNIPFSPGFHLRPSEERSGVSQSGFSGMQNSKRYFVKKKKEEEFCSQFRNTSYHIPICLGCN